MKSFLTTFLLLFSCSIFAQDYFQQEVNYKIKASLDDEAHTLTGEVLIEYVNNSSVDLTEIYFHLWPNAYKNTETTFAQQKKRQGSGKFWFAETDKRGGFDEIAFYSNQKELQWTSYDKQPDMVVVTLNEPLQSGATTEITIPFVEDIPSSFSRLGHVGQSYQMTQWYPKPAVFDKEGWKPMPYLDQGEFYSEFGRFEVYITLPENYVVGATGTLNTASEKAFLREKVAETDAYYKDYTIPVTKVKPELRAIQTALDTFPASSTKMKTLHYSAKNVHDFAWFADKRFKVRQSAVELESGKKVDTYVMFTHTEEHLWKDAVSYVDRSVKFYSDHVGEYPYPHATAVQSALSAGGGMEYPMITVIGLSGNAKQLDDVITHEVGHNWFYGILGTNERMHPWMDEGMNSYYEIRYMRENYEKGRFDLNEVGIPKFLINKTPYGAEQLGLMHLKCTHRAQAPDLDSDKMSSINYGLGAYSKPAIALRQLELSIGTESFDRAMKAYYELWKFKHPTPQDFKAIMEQETGKDLTWFLEDFMMTTKKQNYKIGKIMDNGDSYVLSIQNIGETNAPFPLNGIKDDTTTVMTKWFDGFAGEKDLEIPKGDYTKVLLDGEYETLEFDYRNNIIKTTGSKMRPPNLTFLAGMENPEKRYMAYLPIAAYNAYDGPMLGLALHNWRLPERPFTFMIAPTYGFKSKEIGGLGHVSYRAGLSGNTKEKSGSWVEFGLDAKSFNSFYNENFDEQLRFTKLKPYVKYRAENTVDNNFFEIELRSSIITEEFLDFDTSGVASVAIDNNNYVEGIISFEKRQKINPYSFKLTVESGKRDIFSDLDQSYILIKPEINFSYTYASKKNIDFRLFAGIGISDFTDRNTRGFFNLAGQGHSGFNDYKYEDWFFARNNDVGLFSHQVSMRDGGFKVAIPSNQSANGYNSNSLLVALNLKADLPQAFPGNLPIKPYFDMAFIERKIDRNRDGMIGEDEQKTFKEQFWWNGGFALELGDGIFGIYFPVVSSDNIKLFNSDERASYWNRVSFMLDLKKLSPKRLTDRISF